MADAGFSSENIEIVNTLAPVAAQIAAFHGAVFMKGSRRYELEKALPGEAGGAHGAGSLPGGGGARAGLEGQRSAFTTVSTATPFVWTSTGSAVPRDSGRTGAFPFG